MTKQIFEEGLSLAGVALLKQRRGSLSLCNWGCDKQTAASLALKEIAPIHDVCSRRSLKQGRGRYKCVTCYGVLQGVQGLVDDIERMEPFFTSLSLGQE